MMLGGRQVRCHRSHTVAPGIGLVLLDQLVDITCEGGREQDRVPLCRSAVENSPHCGHEAHVSHAVGLVDHHRGGLAQVHHPALDEILETSRRRYEHVHTTAHHLDLGFDGDAAVDRVDTPTHGRGQRAQFRGDLLGEFTSRSEDQPVRQTWCSAAHPHQHRNPESESLAGTCRRAAHHIMAPEQVGNRGCLDLEGARHAAAAQRRDNRFGYAEFGERGTHRGTLRQRGWCATSASST